MSSIEEQFHEKTVDGLEVDKLGTDFSRDISSAATTAVRFLRDHLLATTGRRIWGLTFTLYPDGKYDIEYDYTKPSDYEEIDEVITGEEINQSLADFPESDSVSSMTVEEAYRAIAMCVMEAQSDSSWERGGVDMDYKPKRQVLMRFWREHGGEREKAPQVPAQVTMVAAADAAYVLHDDLARGGGAAPSGLIFGLTPEGRMNLDYHYPAPT